MDLFEVFAYPSRQRPQTGPFKREPAPIDTDIAHNTRICTCICGYLSLELIHTYTHTPLCGHGLSTGPTEGLSSWWFRNRSPRQPTTTTTTYYYMFKYKSHLQFLCRNTTTTNRGNWA